MIMENEFITKECNHITCKFNEYGFCTADGCTYKSDNLTTSSNVGTHIGDEEPIKIKLSPEVEKELVRLAKEVILKAVEEPKEITFEQVSDYCVKRDLVVIPFKDFTKYCGMAESIPIIYIKDRIKELKELDNKYGNFRYRNDANALENLIKEFTE